MTTIPSNTCPHCGARIPEDSANGLCPRCVFAKALAPTADGGFVPYAPPSLESVRAAFPHLEVTGFIGSGGMGAVFKARQPQLDRFVALKILPSELAGQPGFSERFQREAQALARLSHPHIVTVHDFGRAGDFYFLLMEFIDGVNLRQLLQTKRLTPKEALSIVPPICEALQCAHDHGIVHRDIKPENLLIDKAGTVKIADFGIAKIVAASDALRGASDSDAFASPEGTQPVATMPMGTPDYAAPEQASGSADHRADIYSLGVVLYEMLTGERPTAKLEAPSKRVQVDIRIDEIVLRALEKSPELRFATAAEFRTSVESLAHPLPQVNSPSQGGASLWLRALGVFVALFVSLSVVLAAIRYNSPLGTKELLALVALSLAIAWWTLRRRERKMIDARPAQFEAAGPTNSSSSDPNLSVFSRDPDNWYFHAFYFCRADPRLVVPRRIAGLGWTVNLARPLAIPFVLAVCGVVWSALALVRDHDPLRAYDKWTLAALVLGLAFLCHRLSSPSPSTQRRAWLELPGASSWARRYLTLPSCLAGGAYAAHLFYVISTASRLPDRVATHFGEQGLPNGWMTKAEQLAFMGLMPVGMTAFLGLALWFNIKNPSLLSLPNRDFWLVPERRRRTTCMLAGFNLVLSAILTGFMSTLNYVILSANSTQPPKLDTPVLLVPVIFLLGMLALWVACLAFRFAHKDEAVLAPATSRKPRVLRTVAMMIALGGLIAAGSYWVRTEIRKHPTPPTALTESRASLKYIDATLALDRIKAEHPELAGGVRHVETEGNSMVLDASSPSFAPLQKYLAMIDQQPEAVLLVGTMKESLPNSPSGSGKVISRPMVYTLLGTPVSYRTVAKDGLQIEFFIKAERQTKVKTGVAAVPKSNAAAKDEVFVFDGTVTESARDAPAAANKVFPLPALQVSLGGSVTFTHRLQDGRDVELSIRLARASLPPPPPKAPIATAPPAVQRQADKQPNVVPFKGEPQLRYIAWMPKDETGWQLRTPSGEGVTAPGDIPLADWEGWKKSLLENGTASKITDTAGWLMFFYSHPAIDQRSESRLNLFTPAGAKIEVSQRVSAARGPKAPQTNGWLATGCRVPYAAARGQLKASLALTAGSWWNSEPVAAGKTNNSAGGQFLTNSGEDASHRAFVTVVTEDEDKFPYYQWEVLGRLHDGSDVRSEGGTTVNFQSQYVHTISFGQPLSSYAGFIVRSRERKTFVNDGVHAPPLLVVAPESGSKSTFQMRWVRDKPSADTELMTLAGPRQSETLHVEKAVLLDQSALQSVEAIHGPTGSQIALQFTASGTQRFAQVTREGKGRRLAIIIDGRVQSVPVIQAEISAGRAEISGNFSHEEADDLAARLRASTEDKTTNSYHETTKAARNEHRQKMADLLLKADRAVIFLLDFDIEPDRRLRQLTAAQSGLDLVPDTKFPIYPMGTTANVLDRKTLTEQQLAPLLPHLAQAVLHTEGGNDWCHAPIHGLRLYRGNEEIFESSFCWGCSTFTLLYPDHSDLHPVHDEGLQRLMDQLMPVPPKEMERFKAKWPNLFLFRAPEEVMTQLRNDLAALMELPSSFAHGPDDVEMALSEIHAEIRRQPKAFEYTREELAAFRKNECPYADTDIEKAFAKLQADAGGRPLPELIVFYRTKFTAGALTPRQKTICYRMVSAALLEAARTPAKP